MRIGKMLALVATTGLATLVVEGRANAAPAAPQGPHPRILLDKPTVDALKAKMGDPSSAVGKTIARCDALQGRGQPVGVTAIAPDEVTFLEERFGGRKRRRG